MCVKLRKMLIGGKLSLSFWQMALFLIVVPEEIRKESVSTKARKAYLNFMTGKGKYE